MPARRQVLVAVLAVVATASGVATLQASEPLSVRARELMRIYDSYDLAHLWQAGERVHWDTGLPIGTPTLGNGKHTHCSAFVASVAKRLGIYILRPPEHSSTLLANAQIDWLDVPSSASGWQTLPDAASAQEAANSGRFVVAAYRNHRDTKPGHIAIVRPALRSPSEIAADGPALVQAGLTNSNDTTLRIGFAGHPLAWDRGHEVRFFAHDWDGTGAMQFRPREMRS